MRTPSLRSTRSERRHCRNAARAPRPGEIVMRSFAGTLPAEALCTLTVYMQRHSGDGVLHRHPRPRQRAECGKRQIIYAARPRRFDDMAVRLRPLTADILFSCRRPARPHIPHTRRIRHRPPLLAGIDTVSIDIGASTRGDKKASCRPNAGRMPYISVGHCNGLRESSFSKLKRPPRRTA